MASDVQLVFVHGFQFWQRESSSFRRQITAIREAYPDLPAAEWQWNTPIDIAKFRCQTAVCFCHSYGADSMYLEAVEFSRRLASLDLFLHFNDGVRWTTVDDPSSLLSWDDNALAQIKELPFGLPFNVQYAQAYIRHGDVLPRHSQLLEFPNILADGDHDTICENPVVIAGGLALAERALAHGGSPKDNS